jgi:hypothetical protein
MSNEVVHATRVWDNTCPSAVSYNEHISSLETVSIALYFGGDGVGVFLTHPMLVALLLSRMTSFRQSESGWSGSKNAPTRMGLLGGIEVWATMEVAENEILIVDDPSSLQPMSQIKVKNFVAAKDSLDRMAQIQR